MKRVIILFTILLLLSVTSCKRLIIVKDVKNVIGSTIILPDNLEYFSGSILYENVATPKASIIVWYDSTMCSSCKLSSLDNLAKMEAFCHDSLNDVNMNVIFSPQSYICEPFRETIMKTVNTYPIYLDSCQSFLQMNPHIPPIYFLHTFLLDKDYKVVLCGDPVPNSKMWETYKKHLRLLTRN